MVPRRRGPTLQSVLAASLLLALPVSLQTLFSSLPQRVTQRLQTSPVVARRGSRPPVLALAAAVAEDVAVQSGEAALADDRLLGTWRYAAGSYRIERQGEKTIFRESGLKGELKADGEWLVAELPPAGTIRLQLTQEGNNVQSNFKPTETPDWGETIAAIREWASLESKSQTLQENLSAARFQGSAANGTVEVTVDGSQRPVALKVAPEVALDKSLGPLLKQAHERATEESLDAMTEMLRQVYASHFGGLASVPPKETK